MRVLVSHYQRPDGEQFRFRCNEHGDEHKRVVLRFLENEIRELPVSNSSNRLLR
jgi:hypothetical protein